MRTDSNDKKNKRFIGFSFAWNGIVEVVKSERNFQIHLLATIIVVSCGFLAKLSTSEWLVIILTIGLVLIAEMTNTTIEKTVDYLKPEIHPTAKVIKDIAAGSVLLSVFIAIIIGFIIFLPKLYRFF